VEEGEARPVEELSSKDSEPAETIRRAIRAVNASQSLVADSAANRTIRQMVRATFEGSAARTHDEAVYDARVALRATVDAFVVHLRTAGELPERVLVLLKDALHGAFPEERDPAAADLAAAVVRWAIEAYFRVA
jgi:hypothetical protein